MTAVSHLRAAFVEFLPSALEGGVLYVSIPYNTAVHLCCCGCGARVVTPLDPAQWRITYDGRAVSLAPSIGNWSYPCRSHYWIDDGRVLWASQWNDRQIAARRRGTRRALVRQHEALTNDPHAAAAPADAQPSLPVASTTHAGAWWSRVWRRFRRVP